VSPFSSKLHFADRRPLSKFPWSGEKRPRGSPSRSFFADRLRRFEEHLPRPRSRTTAYGFGIVAELSPCTS